MLRYTPEELRRRFWICDRKRCAACVPECKYTLDKSHAAFPDWDYFEALSTGLYQKDVKEIR